MEDRLITTKEVGNYRIKIYYDTDMECPCKSWDMAACFLWEYSDSYQNGTLRWVDEERQEIDAKGLDCLGYVRELRVDDYLSPTTLEEIAEEIKKKVNRG